MGSCARNCEGTVREVAAEVAPPSPGKKRKIGVEELNDHRSTASSVQVQLKMRRYTAAHATTPVDSGNSTCESAGFDDASASCCSSNGSSDHLAELEEGGENREVAVDHNSVTFIGDSLDGIERRVVTAPSSAVRAESELEPTARPEESMPHGRLTVGKTSIKDDLEEFFAAAEKNLQKQFIDRYNYDIVKDQPLEGRFEWIHIQKNP